MRRGTPERAPAFRFVPGSTHRCPVCVSPTMRAADGTRFCPDCPRVVPPGGDHWSVMARWYEARRVAAREEDP